MPPHVKFIKKLIKCKFFKSEVLDQTNNQEANFFVQSVYMICHAEKNQLSLTPMQGQEMHPNVHVKTKKNCKLMFATLV